MPRIKRWFPVSHDINADAEVWAMRKQIGEKKLVNLAENFIHR